MAATSAGRFLRIPAVKIPLNYSSFLRCSLSSFLFAIFAAFAIAETASESKFP